MEKFKKILKQIRKGFVVEVSYLMIIKGEKVMRRRLVGICFHKLIKRNHLSIGVYNKIRRERLEMFFDLNGTNIIDLKILSSNQ